MTAPFMHAILASCEKAKELVPSYIRHLEIYQAGKPIEELARKRI